MKHVGGERTDERQVVSLIRRMLGSTGECKSESLMISEDGELATLNVVVKVFYHEEDGQQCTLKCAVLLLSVGELPGKES